MTQRKEASLELPFFPSESWGKTPPFCECVMVKGHVHIKYFALSRHPERLSPLILRPAPCFEFPLAREKRLLLC